MSAEQSAALTALAAALVALGVPKVWDLLKLRMGGDATTARLRMQDAIAQRSEWRERVEKLERELDAMRASYDKLQDTYYALRLEHQDCLTRTAALEERIQLLEDRTHDG